MHLPEVKAVFGPKGAEDDVLSDCEQYNLQARQRLPLLEKIKIQIALGRKADPRSQLSQTFDKHDKSIHF